MVASVSHGFDTKRPKSLCSAEACMHAELDYDLTHAQWETLKALRGAVPQHGAPNRLVVDELVALGLAGVDDGLPLITAKGRSVLLRGSPQLLDLAS
jgi:hypothetical protein